MTTTTTTPSSTPALFYPFRALGYITENVPFATQRRGTETFVTVSAGRAWQIYNCDKLRLALVGPQFDGEIVALAVRNDLTFAAVGRDIHVCRRAHKVVTLRAHAAQITSLFVFASLLISVCADGRVMSWDCSREAIDHLDGKISNASRRAREKRERASMAKHEDPEGGGKGGGGSDSDGDGDGDGSDAAALKLRKDATDLPKTDEDGVPRPREFSLPDGFVAAAVCHPRTYLNKILLGSDDGRLLLLNVNTGLNVHVFEPTGGMGNKERAGVTCLEESPALDTIAVGLANGRVIIHNVRVDQKLTDFGHDGTNLPVRCCAFSTATSLEPLLAVGGDSGSVSVWSLEKRRLRTMTPGAHDGKVISATFFDGSPILMTSGGDNAMKQWIFDNRDGTKRLLRFRAGHSAPPTQVTFYGEGGKRLLSAGGDRALRVFSAIQDQQSRELSQSHVERRAKKLKLAELELKLPEISGIAWGETRERDWANIVTCHVGEPRAYTWRLADGILGEHALTPPAKIGARGVAEKGKPICAVAVSACGNFAVVGTEGGDVHRFNLQSGAHRGAYKRSNDADKDLDDDDDDEDEDGKKGKKGKKPFEPRRQLNLRGGANSIWNIADKSYGMDGGGGNGKNSSVTPRAPAHVGPVAAVCCDGANKIVCTAGVVDGACRVW